MKKIIQIKDIGKVTVKKHKLAKSIKLRILPQKGLVVTIPVFCAYEEAYRAIEFRKDWIKKHLSEVEQIEEREKLKLSNFPFKTFEHNLTVIIEAITDYDIVTNDKEITIYIPFTIQFESRSNQDYLKFLIDETYRFEAKGFLPKRVHYFAEKFNLKYNRVSIKKQKTRWGSCSSTNNLNLNLNIMKLPEHLRDYVILHELAHTVEKNHQKPFWSLLDSFTNGEARKLDKELNLFNSLVS